MLSAYDNHVAMAQSTAMISRCNASGAIPCLHGLARGKVVSEGLTGLIAPPLAHDQLPAAGLKHSLGSYFHLWCFEYLVHLHTHLSPSQAHCH